MMNWKQILISSGVAIGAAVGGFYAAPESEMDKALDQIVTVTDTLTPAHDEYDITRDSTGAITHIDTVHVEAKYIPISRVINRTPVRFNPGDTIIYIGIEKRGDSTSVFGLRHIVGKANVSYISKYDEAL